MAADAVLFVVLALLIGLLFGLWVGFHIGRGTLRAVLPVATLLATALPVLASPPEALAVALAHARTLPVDPNRQTRYLDVSHTIGQARVELIQALSFHLNSLSRYPVIKPPQELAGGVLCFDLRDYGIHPDTYLRLGTVDPHFHVKVSLATVQYGHHPPAPWLDLKQVQELYDCTYSQVPILRGDWFLYQTAVQKDRVAGYYDLLGIGKREADFQALGGVDVKKAEELRLKIAATVPVSGVTINNRAIFRLQSLTGGYWFTADYKKSTDKQNTSRLLSGDTNPAKGDASEQYIVLPNRLYAYGLFNDKGERQDTAPDFIASDGRSTSPDRRVHVGLSCIRCHVEGLRPIDDYARRLFREPVFLRSPDYAVAQRLTELYLNDLKAQTAKDIAVFAEAVAACNGLTVAENARVYAGTWEHYADENVTAARAAAELGCDERTLILKIREYANRQPIIDPVMAAYAQTPPLTIRREHFDEVYKDFMKVLGRY